MKTRTFVSEPKLLNSSVCSLNSEFVILLIYQYNTCVSFPGTESRPNFQETVWTH